MANFDLSYHLKKCKQSFTFTQFQNQSQLDHKAMKQEGWF